MELQQPKPLWCQPDAPSEPNFKAENAKLDGEKGIKIIQSFRELMAARLEEAPGSAVTARHRIIHLEVHSREKEPGSGIPGEPEAAQEAPTQHQGHHREGKGEGDAHFCTKNQAGDTPRGGQEIKARNTPRNTTNEVLHVSVLSCAHAKETEQNLKPSPTKY